MVVGSWPAQKQDARRAKRVISPCASCPEPTALPDPPTAGSTHLDRYDCARPRTRRNIGPGCELQQHRRSCPYHAVHAGFESALADVHSRALAGMHVVELILTEACHTPDVVLLEQ